MAASEDLAPHRADDSEFAPIHRLVAEVAARCPDRTAVADEARALTYATLVQQAQAVASTLASRYEVGAVIGVQLGRGCELAVAMLGLSSAGMSALMLDIDGPRPWLQRFVESASAVAVIVDRDSEGFGAADLLHFDDFTATDRAPEVVDHHSGPDEVACLVQTSGSTGEPKLVRVPHRTWTFAARSQCSEHGIDENARGAWLFPAHTNVSASVVVWPFLISGAQLHVPSKEVVGDPPALAEWICENDITQFFAVAPLAEALARLEWPNSALELMLTGSDRVREWGREDLPFEIGNWYGANEVNIVTSSVIPWTQRITSATATADHRSGPPPIGRAWPGTTWRVVDELGDPVEPGAVGELWVGGEQIALGYLGARQTAAKFIPDSAGESGSSIYRTGDLVRVSSAGVFEHCGRVDEQIKVNGMRVEIGDVERVLLDQPGVREAAAAAVSGPDGRPQLVGYVVGDGVDGADVRRGMVDQLPTHMIPVAVMVLESLPRNRGDKIDRTSLPDPRETSDESEHLTASIAEIMADTLEAPSFSASTNFFLEGGDSLKAAKVAKELSRRLEREVDAKQVVLNPTPTELANHLES